MREAVRLAWHDLAKRFSSSGGAPSVDTSVLDSRYAGWSAWPADGELGLLVLGWVHGPGFANKELREAVRGLLPDFTLASRAIDAGQSSAVVTLHESVRRCFRNAAVVVRWNLPPDVLYWPSDLSHCLGARWPL